MEQVGRLLLRLWLADSPMDVTDAEYEALADCFEGGIWGKWQLGPLSPREDWPDGLAYLIDRLESEADTVTTPGDAWRQCHATFIDLKQQRLAASLEPEPDEDYMPAEWFTANTELSADLLRMAARPSRKNKRVRAVGAGKDKRYSVADARTHWPSRFTDRKDA